MALNGLDMNTIYMELNSLQRPKFMVLIKIKHLVVKIRTYTFRTSKINRRV